MDDVAIKKNVAAYLGDRDADRRYASFDYCFNYFQSHRETGRLAELDHGEALERACLHLGFYLASWGMLRGSSTLLRCSMRAFVPVVETLVAAPPALWVADAHVYDEPTINAIVEFAETLRGSLPGRASDILVTKILLGTMGCVPAFDMYFKRGFPVPRFNRTSLCKIEQFYQRYKETIEGERRATLDFDTGADTERRYTRAKVIDMVFFIEGRQQKAGAGR